MDAYPDDHSHERIMLFRVDYHGVKPVMVQNPIIDPFRAGAVIIGAFPFFCAPGYRSIQPDVPFVLCMNGSAIRRIRAGTGAGRNLSQGVRAAPLNGMFGTVVTPADHAVPLLTDGSAVLVNADRIRNGRRSAPAGIQVNKGRDAPLLKELISWIIIIGRIKADTANGNIWCMFTQLMECDEPIYRIMACGTGKTEEKRKIHLKLRIMVIQVVKGIAEKVLIQVGIPAEGCIWVRVMAEAVRMRNA